MDPLGTELGLPINAPADDSDWGILTTSKKKSSKPKWGFKDRVMRDFTFNMGDVEISVSYRDSEIIGRVCADAMALASPVWKKFMYPPWNTTESDSSLEPGSEVKPASRVDFTTDNRDALLVLLRIVHYQFDKIPAMLSHQDLLDIAVLADQYDCHKLLGPWIGNWIKVYDNLPKAVVDDEMTNESSLFVFWVFGYKKRFEKVATPLVHTAQVNTGGEYLTINGNPFPEPSPPHIVQNILARRLATIESLLKIPYDAMDRFGKISEIGSAPEEFIFGFCPIPDCDAIMFGSLQLGLQRKSLWPRKQAHEILGSVEELGLMIIQLKVATLPIYNRKSHNSCSQHFNHENCVLDIMRTIETPLDAMLVNLMEKQKGA